ncbi:MAG: extracellular solute-binding protein [Deltaproteobacteria bacterium]|nr:extracellular solute-binding protein [Deltaproteobacteria bacterium]
MDTLKKWGPLSVVIAVVVLLTGLQSYLRFSAVKNRSSRIVLWHSYIGKEADALKEVISRYNSDPSLNGGFQIEVLSVSFNNLPDKLTNSLPRGQGPDIFIYGHDRLEDWKLKGLLAPLDFWADGNLLNNFFPEKTIDAFISENRLYGIPLTAKNLALYYRVLPDGRNPGKEIKMLQDKGQWNFKNFVKLAKSYTGNCKWKNDSNCYGLGYLADDAYHHAPWLHSVNGRFVTQDGKINITSHQGIRAAKMAWDLAGDHKNAVCPPELTYPLMSDLFNRGEIAMVISGPWFMSQLDLNKIKIGVTSLPEGDSAPASPFLTIEGMYLSSKSENPLAAFRAIRFLTGEFSSEIRAKKAGQLPVLKTVSQKLKALCSSDSGCAYNKFHFEEFLKVARNAIIMPGSAQARIMWPPYTKALSAIIRRNVSPEKALKEAAWETDKYLGACLRRGK